MMAVSKWSLIHLALGDRRGSEGGEQWDLKTRSKDIVEMQVKLDSLTELEAEHSTLVGIASNHDLSIF